MRLGRQRILDRRKPPVLDVIIDEVALRRPMMDPAKMAAQLRHLVKLAAKPYVTIRVLRNPRHPAVAGPYVILDFPPPGQTFVHLEHFDSSAFIDNPDEVRSFQALTETVAQMALTPRLVPEVHGPPGAAVRGGGSTRMAADDRAWRKSSHSAQQTDCVEVAPMRDAAGVRDTKNRAHGELHVSRTAWRAFIHGLTAE